MPARFQAALGQRVGSKCPPYKLATRQPENRKPREQTANPHKN
nr:hypothetical protein [uncultured Kingella sp.]